MLVGCDAPDIIPVAPPGAPIPRTSPDAEPAQAQGEMAVPASPAESKAVKLDGPALATPTAKGETKTSSAGLTYETLKEGTGPELKAGQAAQFLYIAENGWQAVLPGMNVGEVRKIVVPAEPAAGSEVQVPLAPPKPAMVYEVELVQLVGK
jgi:FKBP-type peptidyl-prolyl cis-trans isomerase